MILFHLDGSEKLEVDDGKEGEGNEGHAQEVGDEDVVSCVRQVLSVARGTQSGQKLNQYLIDVRFSLRHLGTETKVAFMLPLMFTMVMFIIFN